MTKLPSGLWAGITNVRARYHATRGNLQITEQTPLTTLLALVDVVIAPPQGHTTPYVDEFTFSGHTLADFPHLPDWADEDLDHFLDWLAEPAQHRQVHGARQRVVMDDQPRQLHLYDYPHRLYSNLRRRLESHPQNRASVAQWRGILRNMQADGIRADEVLWSGLSIALDARPADETLSRTALLAMIDFSAVRLDVTNELVGGDCGGLQFTEVAKSIASDALIELGYELRAGERALLRYRDLGHDYRIGMVRGGLRWFLLDPAGTPLNESGQIGASWFASPHDAMRVAEAHALGHPGVRVVCRPCTRYEHKSLHGGEDYREWLVSLPEYPHSFFGSHYYERNLLLHFRTKQRIDRYGRRLLFVEELQSDWHQSGAMHGYINRWPGNIPVAPFRREWIGLALKFLLMHVAEHDLDGIAWTNGREQERHYGRDMAPVRRIYDEEIPRYLGRLGGAWGLETGRTVIGTREPRLHATREAGRWKVLDRRGGFETRPRYSQREAIHLMARHCRAIDLDVPMMLIPAAMKRHIVEHGLPMFGERG